MRLAEKKKFSVEPQILTARQCGRRQRLAFLRGIFSNIPPGPPCFNRPQMVAGVVLLGPFGRRVAVRSAVRAS